MDRDITVRFYKIEPNEINGADLDAVMRDIDQLQKREREFEVADGIVLRLEHLEETDGLFLGDLTRVQTENLPGHVTDNDNDPLPVDEIGHSAAFCYDPQTECMALQFDIKIGAKRVCNYFQHFSEGNTYGHFPVLRNDALTRFGVETPTKFTIRVARRENFSQASTDLTDFEQAIDQMGAMFEAPSVEVTISCKASDGGLKPTFMQSAQALVQRVLRLRDEVEGITKITAETAESDEVYNFIKFALKETETLDLPENNPQEARQMRIDHLRSVYALHRTYLRDYAGAT